MFFLANSEIIVTLFNAAGVPTLQIEATDYTLTGSGTENGVLTMVTAPVTGAHVVAERSIPRTQLVDLTRGGVLDAETLEATFDKLTRLIQDTRDKTLNLALKLDLRGQSVGHFEALSRNIKSLANAVDLQDALTKGQSDTAITGLQTQIDGLDTDDIANVSKIPGASLTNALDRILQGARLVVTGLFQPATLSDEDTTYMYFGDETWRVRRVLRADGTANIANIINNPAQTTLAAAWPLRVTLTYA